MKDWYASVYKSLIMASVIAFIISFFSTGNVSLGAILSGYSVLILGIMMIILILFNNVLRVTRNDNSTLSVIFSVLAAGGPFILMLGVIGVILYLIIRYKNTIISGHVSHSYYTFSNIAIMLFLMQIYIVYTNISTERFHTTGKISKLTSDLIYLFGVLTWLCSLILFTILEYYTTDGFTMKTN